MSDPTSNSNAEQIVTNHVDINWVVDFGKKTLKGSATLSMETLVDNVSSVTLDTRDLTINKVLSGSSNLEFSVGDKHEAFGSALTIKLPKSLNKQEKLSLQVNYETSDQASALQWLKPEQTAGKQHPYMFSQCQAIHCRSILPCQDTPSNKFPYSAKVTVKSPLVVLMSAVEVKEKREQGETKCTYFFEQKVPIPSYLLAIVAAFLESREIGPRTRVWSESAFVEKAAKEFSETEQMIAAGEKIVGPYVWGRYDLLVLPPSFPYGGMENPCLTFVTPTLLAGDKSLANVVAHEIAHSWTGNLVTNKSWEDFWLNEGHTVFLERKILGSFYGEQTRQFYCLGGLKALKDAVEHFGPENPLTNLVPKLNGIDPDDAFSSVPYEKGSTLLNYLEGLLGGADVFEPFLKSYIDNFKYKSLTTADWKEYLYKYFHEKVEILDSVDWNAWFNEPGMPPVIPKYDDTLLMRSVQLSNRWCEEKDTSGFSSKDMDGLSSKQKIEFLGELLLKESPLEPSKYKAMDSCYHFSKSGNSEIKFRWLMLGLKSHVKEAIAPAIGMVSEQGRMKFTRPLYRSLGAWDASRNLAISNLMKNHSSMHPTTASLVAKDLKVEKF